MAAHGATPDVLSLLIRLERIERRAREAAQRIETGRRAGLDVSGVTALREIEVAARDALEPNPSEPSVLQRGGAV